MTDSTIQVFAAIIMVGIAIGLVFAIRGYMAAASRRRMTGMLERLGLDPAIATSGDRDAMMKEVRQRCRSCNCEDFCERWLAGEEIGDNEFCPNAQVFESMKTTIVTTS